VAPESPTTLDEINVTVGFEISNINENVTFGSVSQKGNGFSVEVDIYVPSILLPTIGYIDQTYDLGKLPAGSYNFTAAVTVSGFGFGFSQYSQSFEVSQGVIIVPDYYPTIQGAINAANNGDTVFVRNGTYCENVVLNKTVTLLGENRETVIVDGNQSGNCLNVTASEVTVSGFTLMNGTHGVWVSSGAGCVLSDDNVTLNNDFGVVLESSPDTIVSNNNVASNNAGIYIGYSTNCTLSGNTVTSNFDLGIAFESCSNIMVFGNNLTRNNAGISLNNSFNNTLSENNVTANNYAGIEIMYSSSNSIFHNNFVNNRIQVLPTDSTNNWDNGYPSGGNYWSDYNGSDLFRGAYQNLTGSDGIGDTPHVIDSNNIDFYPLMNPWSPHDIAVTNVLTSKNVVGQGYNVELNVTIMDLGDFAEDFHVAFVVCDLVHGIEYVYASSECFSLPGSTNFVASEWNTSNYAYGNYTAKAMATVEPGETNAANNVCLGGWITVSIPGDITGKNGTPDGLVDMRDVATIAAAFGSTPSSANWNSNWDINNDGRVDMKDIAIAAAHFGQHYP